MQKSAAERHRGERTMDFGITFPTYIRAWHDARMAEDYGFTHAWFYDSQMCYSDVYAALALTAEHTRHLKIGPLVAILGNRIAPVTAHSIATINELAPGRVILGVGTGFTGRNVMGMPPVKLKTVREHIGIIRELLAGGEARYREGDIERSIRFLHTDGDYVNVKDPIPIHMAANGPKALRVVGELADGWVTIGLDPSHVRDGVAEIKKAAGAAGRPMETVYTTNLTTGCVLRPGEDIMSPRVLRQVGPSAILLLHTNWDPVEMKVGPFAPPSIAPLAKRYFDEHIMAMKTPLEKRYQEMHHGHLVFLREGEEKYLNPDLIRLATLTGSAGEIIDRIHELGDAGITNLALNVCGTDARALIREFGNEIIAKL
jgi:alkanesulfonate monooxygenase SsuD/methylene tetrahydromethanopterin reductase-like flavin-dependent oxidoreductase (luciferase family)